MDINPATPGHALVVPRAHATDLLEIDPDDLAAVALAAQRLARTIEARLGAEGVNLINSCGCGRLADGLPLPRPRHPPLCRRPADAAMGAGAGRSAGDRSRRRPSSVIVLLRGVLGAVWRSRSGTEWDAGRSMHGRLRSAMATSLLRFPRSVGAPKGSPVCQASSSEGEYTHGYWNRQVVQRRQGLRLHHA